VRDSQSTTEVVRTSPERRGAHVEVEEKGEIEKGEKQSKREMGRASKGRTRLEARHKSKGREICDDDVDQSQKPLMGMFEGVATFLPLAGPVPVALARARTAASVRTAEERETEVVRCLASALKDSSEDR
jgi:hypothetical protein